MAVCGAGWQELVPGLNQSERARRLLAPTVTRLLGCDEKVGYCVESIFTTFWQLARKADDMMDYSTSSDLKWLQVLQHVFKLCSSVHDLPPSIPAGTWLKTASRFFDLMSATCRGEVEDLLLARTSRLSSHYNRMVLLKTGPWFTGRIECAALATGSEIASDLVEYGNLACLAYQIRNDIKDAETDGRDITIGKLNYPAILQIQNPLCKKMQVIRMAAKAAEIYEEEANKIANKYGEELELLTTYLCSSS